jgi:transcriptional regulator with XRE-family HTH domain
MAKQKSKPLSWRESCIRYWRDALDLTLEGVCETLAKPPYNIRYTHNSLGRVEHGKQLPKINLIEALAKIYRTDIDSLLNRRPEAAPGATAKGLLALWDRAAPDERDLIIDVAKKVTKTAA